MYRVCMAAIVFLALNLCIAHAATIYVPDDHAKIRDAIIASSNGDTIIVRPGTYVEYINFSGKAITLRSEQGPAVTIIDGNQLASVVKFQSGEGAESVLDGFTVTNGYGMNGGGIYCNISSPTITNNTITGNTAHYYGGGICCYDRSSPTITNNFISDNNVTDFGGGIYCRHYSSPTIINNTIIENTAHGGGGINCNSFSSPTITGNTIIENVSEGGGGISISYYSSPVVTGNKIIGNRANSSIRAGGGGGITCAHSSPTIASNIIAWNVAAYSGGGISIAESNFAFENNTIACNTSGRRGGGLYCQQDAFVTVSNMILWGNDAPDKGPEIMISDTGGAATVNISYSDVKGGQSSCYVDSGCTLNWGTGMIDADPLFFAPGSNDFHLTWNSPCRDAGDNFVVTELYDFEGDPRIYPDKVDMGADEYYYHLYLTDDPEPGGGVTFKVVGDPGTNPVKIYRGSLRTSPLSTQYGLLYIKKSFPHIWNVGPVPADGIATTTKTIPSGVSPGAEFHFQALHGPVGDSDTKLTNLLTVTIE